MATIEDIEQHLRSRGLDPDRTQVIMDKETNQATFLLYNLSGQMVGYQKYNPNGDKAAFNNPTLGRYYSYVAKESDNTSRLAVWGTESITKDADTLFVVEGVFDAVKLRNAGHAAIAVLTNNPKALLPWFKILNKKTVAITDNDAAGKKLGNLTDEAYVPPEGFKDLGEMSQEQVNMFITELGYPPKTDSHTSVRGSLKSVLSQTVKNPDTGNDILIKTALRYDATHPAYKSAMKVVTSYAQKHNIKLRPR
jgi:hypothetical protein